MGKNKTMKLLIQTVYILLFDRKKQSLYFGICDMFEFSFNIWIH
jgi:hypothetical protein